MSRSKYQRPRVYATGKRERLWKAEYRSYYVDEDGKEHARHCSKTWSRDTHTKAQAQAALDKFLFDLQEGPPRRDGAMTLAAFWEQVYEPIRSARWAQNTRYTNTYLWSLVVSAIGATKLEEIRKSDVELLLIKLATDKSQSTVKMVHNLVHSLLEEAADNEYIQRNPARKLRMPATAAAPVETRSLTEAEVRRLWDTSTGGDYVFWRVMLLTGMRPSECFALQRCDILPAGLLIDHSGVNGRQGPTKNKKVRVAPLPESLRAELAEWLTSHDSDLIFPAPNGRMIQRSDWYSTAIRDRARKAAGIPDLTFRQTRTTFATLFEGDLKDAQAILGHHSASFTLAVYRKPIMDRQQAAVESLDGRLRVVEIKRRA